MDQYHDWLEQGYAGEMAYLHRHLDLRAQPGGLLPGARTILMVTMPYLPGAPIEGSSAEAATPDSLADWREAEAQALGEPLRAVVSVYARGRDYHKVLRQRLMQLAAQLASAYGGGRFRACVDSAPLREVEIAERAGLGWRGKNTLLLSQTEGSMFFLGSLLTDLEFPVSPQEASRHCGSCSACLDLCPTQAFVGPYQLDARRCISYLTIEHHGDIPVFLRPHIGNRVYGCDDCQRVCPWNRYARRATLPDFAVRHGLDQAGLMALFSWTEQEFLQRHQGSAILRIGYSRWLRNLAVGLGNALAAACQRGALDQAREIRDALLRRADSPDSLVARHVAWALDQGALS
jgi:epoxyqueuosine reductase